MNRTVIALIFLLIFLSGIIFFLFRFRENKRPINSAIRAIPASAAFVIETRQTRESWRKISETNIIWEELLNINSVSRLNREIKAFDSLYTLNPLVKEIFDGQSLFISAHMTDEKNFNFIFLFNIPPSVGSSAAFGLSGEISSGYSSTVKEYDGASITTVHPEAGKDGDVFSYTIYNDIFIGSFNVMLVEDVVRQINTGKSLMDDFAFQKVMATTGGKSDANLLINHKFFPDFISSLTKKEFQAPVSSLKNFADWTALDLKIKPNVLMLNGFTLSNDSLSRFLNLFGQQKPQAAEFTEIIPSNTSAFVHFGFSNFGAFYKNYRQFLDNSEKEEKINAIQKECSCDIEKYLLSWVENEMAVMFTESVIQNQSADTTEQGTLAPGLPGNFFAVFKSNKIREAERLLSTLTDSVIYNGSDSARSEEFPIKKLKYPHLLSLLLGNLFSDHRSEYFTIIDDYVVFANDIKPLVDFISRFASGKTLSKKISFNSFSENLSAESNIFVYADISHSLNMFRHLAGTNYHAAMDEHEELFRKFEAVAIQISNENSQLFYNNIFLKYNPSHKQEISTIWETKLDNEVHSRPLLLTNHYTQAKEVFVQDDANLIYLISGTGKVLWKRPLSEKIISGISQVDALKNNKLQMLFNTASSIYLVDRNGKDVTGFPLKLEAPASTGLTVIDYDKNRNYRILIPCSNGVVYNYEIGGQPVKGWDLPKMKGTVKKPFLYFSQDGKDYLTCIDEKGNIYVLDRSGKNRVTVNGKLAISKNNSFFIEPGKNIGKTRIVATDSTGNIIRIYFNGNIEHIKIDDFSDQHFFGFWDINNDKSAEYIFADKNDLKVYAQDNLRYSLFNYRFESEITQHPLLFDFPDNKKFIGIPDSRSNKICLFDEKGAMPEDFPIFGNTSFSIGDINHEGELYLVTGSGNHIFTYLLK